MNTWMRCECRRHLTWWREDWDRGCEGVAAASALPHAPRGARRRGRQVAVLPQTFGNRRLKSQTQKPAISSHMRLQTQTSMRAERWDPSSFLFCFYFVFFSTDRRRSIQLFFFSVFKINSENFLSVPKSKNEQTFSSPAG